MSALNLMSDLDFNFWSVKFFKEDFFFSSLMIVTLWVNQFFFWFVSLIEKKSCG